jgi:acetyl-CoA C-acetyltransferase
MSLNGKAYIVGAYEHPTRKADDLSVVRLHADVAKGALADAGLSRTDIDGYFCAGDAPGLGATTMVEYLGLKVRHDDSTECGGSAPMLHVAHAAEAIAAGRCNVALITLAGRPRAAGAALALKAPDPDAPELAFELPYGPATQNL